MRELQDSGIEWIGIAPSSWKVTYLSSVLSERKHKNVGMQEDNLLSLSYGNVKQKDINTNDGLLPESFEGYNIIEDGDIVLRLTDLQNDHRSLRTGLCRQRGIITSAYCTLKRNNGEDDPRYLRYYLHCFDLCKGFYGMGAGVRQGLNFDGIRKIEMLLPTPVEQTAISDYLDAQIEKVDALIANQQAQIEKLKQYKQSLITEVVTKGLNPDSPMKDSGNDLLGQIPAHWKAIKIKYLCSMQAGRNLISEQISDSGDYPVYGGNGLRGYFTEPNYIGECLLVGRQGALCGNVHHVSGEFWATEHAVITEPKEGVSIRYLFYLLTGMNLNLYVSPTAAQPGLSVSTVQNVISCLAPVDEQEQIVKLLDDKIRMIESLLQIKEKKIESLTNYKKSVIYEYVTGKKEVV